MRFVAILMMLLTAVAGAAGEDPVVATCTEARLVNGWCETCKIGYVASVPVRNHALFEALDAHGHHMDVELVRCPTCREAIATDGYCERCRLGYVRSAGYFSRLTWTLARGKLTDLSKIECAECRKHSQRSQAALTDPTTEPTGWCRTHRIGWVGNVAFRDAKHYKAAAAELPRLLAAIRMSPRCDLCAVALFMDKRCPLCDIQYRDGKELCLEPEAEPAPPPARSPATTEPVEG